ncbi:hypothetical protein E2C01_021576 [Portunus trituberculatus]|uniref:Uncharacterized protein n=1 Tax=Portunus trituberculatus TaxID=210409 RepID=A0A5B7E520_PORTR|nr:hypothetical protein [Portunus trituberculatus]
MKTRPSTAAWKPSWRAQAYHCLPRPLQLKTRVERSRGRKGVRQTPPRTSLQNQQSFVPSTDLKSSIDTEELLKSSSVQRLRDFCKRHLRQGNQD